MRPGAQYAQQERYGRRDAHHAPCIFMHVSVALCRGPAQAIRGILLQSQQTLADSMQPLPKLFILFAGILSHIFEKLLDILCDHAQVLSQLLIVKGVHTFLLPVDASFQPDVHMPRRQKQDGAGATPNIALRIAQLIDPRQPFVAGRRPLGEWTPSVQAIDAGQQRLRRSR